MRLFALKVKPRAATTFVSAAPCDVEGENDGQIDWIRFRVEIRFPENADPLPVPDDF
jgi:hypothetical protein